MSKTILYRLSLNSTDFQSGLQNAEKALQRASKSVEKIGENLSTYVTAPIMALGTVSVMAWDKQAKAMAQVEQGLITTGHAAGFAKEELFKMASDLQGKTLFDDDEILKSATAQLLTFTNIAGEQFAQAQVAALNLATRLDGDLKNSSIMLGKALNDPIQGLLAMRRVGISFTDSQTDMIKALAASGDLMGAQNLILAELERQYGGSAEAAVVGAGKIIQLKNSVGDLMEEFGRIIMDYITPFVDWLRRLITQFQALDESAKRTIVVIAGIAAAIGPVLLGVAALIKMFSIAAGVIAAITSPITLVIAAIAALGAGIIYLWQNWSAVTERISDWGWWRNMLIDMVKFLAKMQIQIVDLLTYPIRKLAETFGLKIPTILKTMEPLFNTLDKLKTEPKKYEHAFGSFGDAVKGAARDAGKALGIFTDKAAVDINKVTGAAITAANAVAGVGGGGSRTSPVPGIAGMTAVQSIGVDQSVWDSVSKTVAESNAKIVSPDFETGKLTAFGERYKEMAEGLSQTSQHIMETMQGVGQSVGSVFDQMGMRIVESLGLADEGFQGFIKGIMATVVQLISMMLAQSIAQSIAGATASGAATGPAAIFTTPAFIATAVGGVLAAFASIPKFAAGGLAYGPTLAMVGDNRNSKTDPEIIAPLSKLKGMMGSNTMMVQDRIEIDGNKLYVLFKRIERNNFIRT